MLVTEDEIWAVEWDPESNMPHIQLLKETVIGNIRSIRSYKEKRTVPGYLLVGIAATQEAALNLSCEIEREFGVEEGI
jgi:hypothetical protein